ncbi:MULTISPECIES: tyrosine-type recombinase/integrase [Pumilibacter]|uniref:tyrosine-type recombinase/integrase n=1 Tax=Pumilibacter TaxID=2941493 RepID=UPI002040348F|nr:MULTISPECIES: site-specific integrase [Pumilibacter]
MQYKEWLNEWLECYVKPTTKSKTYIRYSEIVRGHIIPKIGSYEIGELTPLVLQRFVTELLSGGNLKTGTGLSSNSVNGIITVIQNSLKSAFAIGIVPEYNADKIKRPKVKEKQVVCFTKQEQRQIEQAILDGYKSKLYGVILCLYTGLRIGELLALEWSDVDLQKGIISVNKTRHDGKGNSVNSPKTETSRRMIPIPKQLLPFMKEWKKNSLSRFVVSNGEKYISVRGYQRMFERLLNRIGIEHKGFHALRHTFATRALECGMDVKTLSEILGHKNATVTLNRYVHSLVEHKQEMMNVLGKLIYATQSKSRVTIGEI